MKKYLVGGAVRDKILNLPVKERDWVVVGATPQDMLKKGYKQVGKSFPVFLHPKNGEEYALARTELKIGQGHTGFICNVSNKVTLEEDLRRRDLTINAIACNSNGDLVDPFYGLQDIHDRCLRHVSDAFTEDPLRILRVARFAAKFAHLKFKVAPETMLLMRKMTNELGMLTSERIWKETRSALITNNPNIYFQILYNCGALKILFPEIYLLFRRTLSLSKRLKINIGDILLINLSKITQISDDITVRFAKLCYDIGKYYFIKQKKYYNKKIINALGIVENFCNRLKVPNQFRELAKLSIQYCDSLHHAKNLSSKKLINIFNNIDIWRKPDRLEKILLIKQINCLNKKSLKDNQHSTKIFLKMAFYIISSINVNDIINLGFKGNQISKKLNQIRQCTLIKWRLNNINNI